jgi:hypothetical protein
MCVLAVVTSPVVVVADFALDWYTVDGGGEMWTTGGDFELSGTIGQPDANAVAMTGSGFVLTGGFWAAGAPESPIPGDVDGDVDLADLTQLLVHYGVTQGVGYEDGDLDGDGDVDLADLAALLANYGMTAP